MNDALSVISWIIAILVCVPLAVFAYELLAGLWPSRGGGTADQEYDTVILIPAHDEAGGIAATLAPLCDGSHGDLRVVVIADNCTDNTAELARLAGAEVIERHDKDRRGKGYALAFGRDHLAAQAKQPDAVIVLDADCRLGDGSIEALADAAVRRNAPAQAVNLIDGDLTASPMVQVGSLAMVVKNLYRSRGMQRLGGAALLTGTGMAFPWPLFAKADLATGSIVEDLALGIELTQGGHPPRLVGQANVRSAPADMQDALAQRTRWEHGFLQTLKSHALPTLAGGLKRASLSEMLLGLHLMVPPLALLLILAGLVLAALFVLAFFGASVLPAVILGGLLLLVLALVFIAWLAGGRAHLSGGALLRIPFYLLWKIPLYLGFLRKPEASWKRTPRRP